MATPGWTAATLPSVASPLLLDLEPDELERVVLALAGRWKVSARDRELGAARRLAVEPDHGPAARALRPDDLGRLAVDDAASRRPRSAPSSLARLLDEERAVEAVRLADAADPDELAGYRPRLDRGSRLLARDRRKHVLAQELLRARPIAAPERVGDAVDVERRLAQLDLAVVEQRPEGGELALVRQPTLPALTKRTVADLPVLLHVRVADDDCVLLDALEDRRRGPRPSVAGVTISSSLRGVAWQ